MRRAYRRAAVIAGGLAAALSWQPLSTFLFPRAEEVLKDQGLDPGLVRELAPGKKVYVRTSGSFLGRMHAALDYMSPVGGEPKSWDFVHNDTNLGYNSHMTENVCRVYVRLPQDEPRYDSINFLRKSFSEVDAWRSPALPAAEDNFKKVLLHEIRHCSDENTALSRAAQEGDADHEAIRVLARESKKPELKELFYRQAAFTGIYDDLHDTVLYMVKKDRGEEIPSDEALLAATNEAFPFAKRYMNVKIAEMAGRIDPACGPSMENCAPALSGLAEERFNLFKTGADHYLTPKY